MAQMGRPNWDVIKIWGSFGVSVCQTISKISRCLNQKILRLAMQLHAREDFTDVVSCDGSKKDCETQPWNTTYKTGPTTYGHYGGPTLPATTAWAARFQTAIPTQTEMALAIQKSSWGHRRSRNGGLPIHPDLGHQKSPSPNNCRLRST